jgi:hypothetical protein
MTSWVGSRFQRDPLGACRLTPDASLAQFVAHLNQNIAQLQAWRSTDVVITARGQLGVPVVRMSAVIAVQSPRNFRLRVSSVGGDEADLGSNEERFWFWIRRNDPPFVFTSRHDQMQVAQQRMPIPFQPDWLMEALGVIPLDETQWTMHRDSPQSRTVWLASERKSPDGRPVRQMILIDTCHGVVLQHSLYDLGGQLIAKATLGNHRYVGNGVVVPHRIDLDWPQAGLALSMHLGTVEVNPVGLPEQMWQLPSIPGAPRYDLDAVQPAGMQMPAPQGPSRRAR